MLVVELRRGWVTGSAIDERLVIRRPHESVVDVVVGRCAVAAVADICT